MRFFEFLKAITSIWLEMSAKATVHASVSCITHFVKAGNTDMKVIDVFQDIFICPKGKRLALIIFMFMKHVASVLEPLLLTLVAF